jgi:hypothetical protein
MKPSLNIATLCSAAFVLQACVSNPPSPALIAASLPNASTPQSVSGEQLGQCLKEAFGSALQGHPTIGAYDPSVTLAFTKEMARGGERWAAYAPRVRAYVATAYVSNTFRSGYAKVACYYELSNQQLRYLSFLRPDSSGRVDRQDMFSAIRNGYAKMTGKDPLKLAILGDY